ncbi:hypothetical protein CHN51_11380 [Sphingorhabdus sp. YGSMI21]|nr:hypothetical protein CHN51_11380 [Sphingorhabdus sp. YGSMI21]
MSQVSFIWRVFFSLTFLTIVTAILSGTFDNDGFWSLAKLFGVGAIISFVAAVLMSIWSDWL